MFKKMPNASNLLYTMLVVVLFTSCEKESKNIKVVKKEPELILGKKYVTSFDWKSENPFKKKETDTVIITGLKNGYVEWQYKEGYKQSCKIGVFRLLMEHNH